MSSGILPSFVGALQASVAVLLTIFAGSIASRYNLLKESSSRDISKTCVRLFLPALLITNVGSELHADTALRYVPVLIWALVYTLSSMALGWTLRRIFPRHFPAWTTPAICFNNTTALPLLLIQSLETAGILNDLLMGENDTSSAALSRAKSYFLVSSMVGNSLTFAIGPKLLDDEECPDEHHDQKKTEHVHSNGRVEGDEEHAHPEHANESTTLLPNRVAERSGILRDQAIEASDKQWLKLPAIMRKALEFAYSFLNAPLIGALIGAFIGLIPPLHKAFFNDPSEGGFFKAWLTASVKNVGELFAALQLVVVGAKLSGSLLKMKKGEASGEVRLIPLFTIFFIRFILWPVISIAVIFLIATKTSLLTDDPILWFVLMLMPTGPPATKLTALADVSGADENEKMSIAKFVTISYAASPVICFAVVGSLKASLAVK
ncbi:uncharacterized protein LY89DRAFT_578765 [Mollisia scopiformis]|uniref:Auxin efflux carrier n=1 Tax=Mollisia scopiformis TaxID=149040 RepID=A0A194XJ77_MOLSC|nr:uncharacterized protein LY89DRAFT_578765 [Mollisia scopiformis]KUJ20305.1 hypothetical protein LY89DRAFT_578765 [Mollisia scopiformis]